MKTIWKAKYENNDIEIINTWFNGERLLVNGVLQDRQISLASANLRGHLFDSNGKRLHIKANLGGFSRVKCMLFIDDKAIEVEEV
jgi:hypothetical protein